VIRELRGRTRYDHPNHRSFLHPSFSLPLFAGEKTDVIVMKNGDRFTCEIKSLSAGVLYKPGANSGGLTCFVEDGILCYE
jgi:hypothetical protein